MSDIGVVPGLLSVLRSIPLWILVGFAAAGYAGLFVPAFGEADLTDFRRTWGAWLWLDAIAFTVLSIACAIDLAIQGTTARMRRRRRLDRRRYYEVYAPLYSELMKIQI